MGRGNQSTAYRDDPDAVSLHTTPDDYSYDDAPEITTFPPSYADSEADNVVAPTAPPIRHLPPPTSRMDHNAGYTLKKGKPQVCETQTVMDPRYDTDPVYLEEGVLKFANQAPIPLVYIMGTHKETVKRGDKKETQEVTDFRIVMNLQRYLWRDFIPGNSSSMTFAPVSNGDKTYRGGFKKTRAPGFKQDIEVGSTAPTAQEWYHRYCASSSLLRVFRFRREVVGFDETFLKNRIEGLIRSTNYRGHLSITFPVEDRNVDIYSSNRINEWRLKTWIRWVFYLTFLWIFTWPYLFFATKRYAVVVAQWPFSFMDQDGNKIYSTVSEEQWFEKWHIGIRRLVLDRFQGEASEEQLAGVIARPADPPMPGTISTGHAGIDNAVGYLQQGLQVAGAISRGNNLSRSLQGGWGYDC
ncbi:hypothetical protein BU24DRAFT_422421 [Aaosphaeria arxii CBS 175.79]|uniref:Uncharacterized protein n=1 Tax=Aaosphaeria arxii CBS 175.79 TaxID=1450172 RepID=A0A6A5XS14_9PLEO|nr:uncharacterized protein BU24DRAFT_422421 [Aaosphaeria arxii CBS 175.79]KAF2016088.1 hypothetical protein BU24DRAFT_422421 [Aaosphaeria arxii CBS 175.79]